MRGKLKLAMLSGVAVATGLGAQAAAAADAASAGPTVAEVVITGQKRTSTVQNTAATVNVVTADALEATGTTGTTTLQFSTPGLMVSQDLGLQTQVFIRGIGSNLQGVGTGNSVSTYVDGVYIPNSIASAQSFTDVARIEVLKGPQATLYGRNATGGAISIVTREPEFSLSGSADVSYGNYNTITGHLMVTGPLVQDKVAFSLAAQTTKHDGYVDNLFDGHKLNYEDVKGVRGALKFVVTPDIDVVLRADYTDILESDVYKVIQPTSYYYIAPPSTLANQTPRYYSPDPRKVYYNTDNRNPGLDRGLSATAHWHTPIGVITSVTSERKFNAGPIFADNDQTPLYSVIFGVSLDTIGSMQSSKSFYHETYLTTDLQGPLNFVFGANYFDDKERQFDHSVTSQSLELAQTKAQSVFIDGGYDLTSQVRLVAGLRYSSEIKDFSRTGVSPVVARVTNKRVFDNTSPRIGVEYRPHAGLLLYATATNGFKSGGFNQSNALNSFNPEKVWSYEGGVKTRLWDNRVRLASSAFYYDYKDIQVLQYVLAPLPGATVATLQQLITNAATATVYGLDNDADFAVTDKLTVGAGLSLLHTEFGHALFCDPKTGSCAPAATATFTPIRVDIKGNRLARAPDVSANIYAEYKIPANIPGELKLRGDASYRGKTYFTVFQSDDYKTDPFWLFNANLRYDAPKTWYGELFVQNIADKLATTNIINSSPVYSSVTGVRLAGTPATFARYVAPRTYGVRIGLKF